MKQYWKHSIVTVAILVNACKTGDFTGASDRTAPLQPLQTKSFTQDIREVRQVQVKQGVTGANGNENYNVTAMGIVDIVVVVDTSGSMAEEQANLAPKLSSLLSAIQDTDWKIVVTTTDPADRCGYGPISKGDSNAASKFQSYVNAGINGTGLEQPILRAVQALKGDCLFGPGKWLRSNSTVAVLLLTDEDNCHIDNQSGYGCLRNNGQREDYYYGEYLENYLASIRNVGTDAKVYGIFWHPSQSQSQCSTALKTADILADLVLRTGGTWGSICDSDYGSTLTRISQDVAQVLKADFVLRSVPDAGTLKIIVNGQPWTAFTLTGTAVHFTSPPPVGASIQVSYISGAQGVVTNQFAIQDEPADGSIFATVNGANVGSVTYDSNSKMAVFSQRPADGSTIVISYKLNSPLKTIFEIAPDADTKYLVVAVNGKVMEKNSYTYDGKTGVITFKSAPPEGSPIKVDWRGKKKTT